MTSLPRIALVQMGEFSHINRNVHAQLQKNFPGSPIDVIDIAHLKLRAPLQKSLQYFAAGMHYGAKAWRSRGAMEAYGVHTPYFFSRAKHALRQLLANGRYAFTMQTQSVFDASQPGVPHFLYTDHTHQTNLYYPAFDRSALYSRDWINLEKTIYGNTRVNFTMSSHVKRSIIEQYGIDPVQVELVYIGSNVAMPDETALPPQRYRNKEILFVGIDWERKGGPLLARAFERVLKIVPDAKLTVVGCSPALDLPNCRVLGRLPLSEVAAHYKTASLFCMPTQNEPFGIVFLEAFAHRLPVIATNIGALPDMVENGVSGYLIEPTDVAALTAHLIALLTEPAMCEQFGRAGFARMQNTYTWDSTGQRMARTIREVVGV
jgi:glycosyltransferase involved in cell wall biosynthesis